MRDEDYLSSSGTSSLRTFLSGVKRRNTTADQGASAYMQSNYDPRFSSLSMQRAKQFGGYAQDAAAAEGAAPGSIAARNDPNRWGSVASQQHPGVFGPGMVEASQKQAKKAQDSTTDSIGQATASYLAPQMSAFYTQFMNSGGMQRRTPPTSPDISAQFGDDNG